MWRDIHQRIPILAEAIANTNIDWGDCRGQYWYSMVDSRIQYLNSQQVFYYIVCLFSW